MTPPDPHPDFLVPYGKVTLLKSYCPFCRRYAIILDHEFLCCFSPYPPPDLPLQEPPRAKNHHPSHPTKPPKRTK